MNQFTQQINSLLVALPGVERIFDMMNETQELDEGTVTLCNVRKNGNGGWEEYRELTHHSAWEVPGEDSIHTAEPHTGPRSGSRLIPLEGDVCFSQVVLGYTSGGTILNGISLYAKPGQKITFVGSTETRKTTIVNLVDRLYEMQQGSIAYDGIGTKTIKEDDLRHSFSMVIQDTHLFTGIIAGDIRYGRLNATDEDVVSAARTVSAHSFIRRLPQGYDTPLHSDGANLSQGQCQSLTIARAAISRPPMPILDEATSPIDTRTEKLIEEGMDVLMDGRTVFVITHRLSTIRNSRAIMALERGEIIERGSHDELIDQRGRYYKLYTGQSELE